MIADSQSCRDAANKGLAANVAKRAGRYDEAIRLHTEVLEAIVRVHGERSFISALSFNDFGETLLVAGRLDEAADAFAKALVVMDDQEFGGMGLGPRVTAAMSRDNMARVLEARDDFPGAREMRLKGADKGHTRCGCDDVRISTLDLNMIFVRAPLIKAFFSPTIVLSLRRRHDVPLGVESLRCVPLCILLQPRVPEEGLDHETQAALQAVHGIEAVSCQLLSWRWHIRLKSMSPSKQCFVQVEGATRKLD